MMNDKYLIVVDKGNGEVNYQVDGLADAKMLAEIEFYLGGSPYVAVVDGNNNRVYELTC